MWHADSLNSYILSPFFSLVKTLLKLIICFFSQSNRCMEFRRIQQGAKFTRCFVSSDHLSVTSYQGFKTSANMLVTRIVIGSDQVWNYRWLSKEDLAIRLGSFVPDDVPIISYAASFGVSEVSDDVRPIFQKYLPRLKAISVREDRGAELVKEMTGLDVTIVLDPTLMLDMSQWNSITRAQPVPWIRK